MKVQAGGATVSKTHPLKTLSVQNAEARTQDVTSNTYIYTSPIGISSSESTLVNTPTEARPPMMLQQENGEGGPSQSQSFEDAKVATPGGSNSVESLGTIRSSPTSPFGLCRQEDLLRTEEAAHQETRNKLARLEAWCEGLCDENTALQTQLQNADDETKKIRKELADAEDEETNLRTQLSDAESNIREFKKLLPEIQRMVERESSLRQLGIDVYSRLQAVGRLISPHDRVWAEYIDLMNAVAQRSSTFPNARDESMDSHDASRIEELGEVEDGDGRERGQNETGAPAFNTDMMGDNALTNEVDAVQAEGYGTVSDDEDNDDDDFSRHGCPMRPGTASRLSMSTFTAQFEERPGQPSSSPQEAQEVQEACEPALSAPSPSHPYPEAPADLEGELESSNGFKFTFGSNHTIFAKAPTAEEADLSQATGEGIAGSIPQPETSQPIFSFSFDDAGETSRAEAPRRRNYRNDGRGNQNTYRNKSRLQEMSELAYDPAIFDFSRQSQPEESVRSSSFGVTENGDSEPLEAGNEPGSQALGAIDANVDATAPPIDPFLEPQYNLLVQSTNTVAELREARDGKARMTDSEPEDAPSEKLLRATWAPFPWVEVEVEIKKSPAELMKELPFDWMLPTPPTVRLSDGEGRIGESSRRRYSSAVQDGMHMANMKAWIDSIAPLEKGLNSVETLKIQPSRATSRADDSKNAEGRNLDAMPLSEDQTKEAEIPADGQTQEMKASSRIQTTQAPQMDLPPFEEEVLSLINGIQKLSLGPSIETAGTAFEEELLSLTNGIKNLSLGPAIDAAGKVEKESEVQVPRNSNVSDQEHTENLENLINGIRDLSLGSSVDEAGRHSEESKVQLSGDWNVSGLGQYSPKDVDRGPIFERFLGRKSEVRDPGFTAKKERIAAPKVEITKEINYKCKKAHGVVMPSKERSTREADVTRQEQQRTTSPVPINDGQRNINTARAASHSKRPKKQDVTTNQPAVTTSPTEPTTQNALPHQPLEPRPAITADHQPPPPSEEEYVSVYSLQGVSYPDTAPKTKYRDPFGLRKERK